MARGHDLIEWVFPPSRFEPRVLDLTDVNQEAERRFGKQLPFCKRSSFNPRTNAAVLAERGADVVVVEPGGDLAAELGLRPRWQFVADLRARKNVTVFLGTTVEQLGADDALLRRAGEDIELHGLDLIVPTRPLVPACALGEALKALDGGPAVFEVGDCREPRTAFDAMQEAAALGHRL